MPVRLLNTGIRAVWCGPNFRAWLDSVGTEWRPINRVGRGCTRGVGGGHPELVAWVPEQEKLLVLQEWVEYKGPGLVQDKRWRATR